VSLRRVEAIIEGCKVAGLEKFIRVKEEINKDAMLAEPDQAMKVPGVTINLLVWKSLFASRKKSTKMPC